MEQEIQGSQPKSLGGKSTLLIGVGICLLALAWNTWLLFPQKNSSLEEKATWEQFKQSVSQNGQVLNTEKHVLYQGKDVLIIPDARRISLINKRDSLALQVDDKYLAFERNQAGLPVLSDQQAAAFDSFILEAFPHLVFRPFNSYWDLTENPKLNKKITSLKRSTIERIAQQMDSKLPIQTMDELEAKNPLFYRDVILNVLVDRAGNTPALFLHDQQLIAIASGGRETIIAAPGEIYEGVQKAGFGQSQTPALGFSLISYLFPLGLLFLIYQGSRRKSHPLPRVISANTSSHILPKAISDDSLTALKLQLDSIAHTIIPKSQEDISLQLGKVVVRAKNIEDSLRQLSDSQGLPKQLSSYPVSSKLTAGFVEDLSYVKDRLVAQQERLQLELSSLTKDYADISFKAKKYDQLAKDLGIRGGQDLFRILSQSFEEHHDVANNLAPWEDFGYDISKMDQLEPQERLKDALAMVDRLFQTRLSQDWKACEQGQQMGREVFDFFEGDSLLGIHHELRTSLGKMHKPDQRLEGVRDLLKQLNLPQAIKEQNDNDLGELWAWQYASQEIQEKIQSFQSAKGGPKDKKMLFIGIVNAVLDQILKTSLGISSGLTQFMGDDSQAFRKQVIKALLNNVVFLKINAGIQSQDPQLLEEIFVDLIPYLNAHSHMTGEKIESRAIQQFESMVATFQKFLPMQVEDGQNFHKVYLQNLFERHKDLLTRAQEFSLPLKNEDSQWFYKELFHLGLHIHDYLRFCFLPQSYLHEEHLNLELISAKQQIDEMDPEKYKRFSESYFVPNVSKVIRAMAQEQGIEAMDDVFVKGVYLAPQALVGS